MLLLEQDDTQEEIEISVAEVLDDDSAEPQTNASSLDMLREKLRVSGCADAS